MKELQAMSVDELTRTLNKAREELRETRFRVQAGQEKKVRSLRVMRQTIARTMTTLAAKKKAVAPKA